MRKRPRLRGHSEPVEEIYTIVYVFVIEKGHKKALVFSKKTKVVIKNIAYENVYV